MRDDSHQASGPGTKFKDQIQEPCPGTMFRGSHDPWTECLDLVPGDWCLHVAFGRDPQPQSLDVTPEQGDRKSTV